MTELVTVIHPKIRRHEAKGCDYHTPYQRVAQEPAGYHYAYIANWKKVQQSSEESRYKESTRQATFEMSRPNTSHLGIPNAFGTPSIRQRNPGYISEASSSRQVLPNRGTDRKGKGKEKEKVKGRWEVGTKGWVKDGFRKFGAHCARNQVSHSLLSRW
jgi:hypothetical protein